MQNKIDFSGLERITPRADSFEKVCARLDAKQGVEYNPEQSNLKKQVHLVHFSFMKAIPLAASLVLVGAGIFMAAISGKSERISIQSITTDEVASWYNNLGSDGDDFDSLDENVTLSYFYKEIKK